MHAAEGGAWAVRETPVEKPVTATVEVTPELMHEMEVHMPYALMNIPPAKWAWVEVTPELMHEMEVHMPYALMNIPPAKWAWIAGYLNNAPKNPNKPCPCCGATPKGDDMPDINDLNARREE